MSDLLAMQRAVWRSARPTTEKIVLLAIVDYYSEASPQPWPSVPTLASQASLGRTAVLEAIAALERDGVLFVKREHGRPNRYDLSRVCVALAPVRHADQSAPRTPVEGAINTPSPVRQADPSATRTGAPDGRDQSGTRTGPVRQADPKEPMKEPMKEASRARDASRPLRGSARAARRRARETCARAAAGGGTAAAAAMARGEEDHGGIRACGGTGAQVGGFCAEFRGAGDRSAARGGEFGRGRRMGCGECAEAGVWRSGGKTRGLASLSPEVVARALEERDQSLRAVAVPARTARGGGRLESGEERRIHRNALLAGAEAGRYGAEVQRRAESGVGLLELADELERREARGELAAMQIRVQSPPREQRHPVNAPRLAKSVPERNASRCLADLVARLADDSSEAQAVNPVKTCRSVG